MSLKLPREMELQNQNDFLKRSLEDKQCRNKLLEKRLCIFAALAACLFLACLGLSYYAYSHGNSQYDLGYEAGHEAGVAETKELYSRQPVSGATVYITANGSKYHEKGCSYLVDGAIPVSMQDAKSRGYTACSRCNPPG